MPEDRPNRNKCPGSTFAVRSVAQLPTLTRRQQMEVQCTIIGRSTEVRCCLQTVRDNCAGLIARLASLVALSDRSGVAGATTTTARTSGRCGQRYGQPVNSLRARSQFPPGEPLDDSPLPNCPVRGRRSDGSRQSSCSPSFAGPRRWHSRGAWSLATPRLGQRVSKEP